MAGDGDVISLRVEDVRTELTKIMREAQEMPAANQVMQVVGASSGSAADFHARVRAALGRAAQSAAALMGHLDHLDAQVRAAVEALSGQDMEAETTFASLNGAMPEPIIGVPPPTTQSPTGGFA